MNGFGLGRIYLRLRAADHGNFNLHVVERAGAHWTNNLGLRDLLRRDAAARTRYAAGKQAALATAGNRLLAYSAAKRPLIEALLMVPVAKAGKSSPFSPAFRCSSFSPLSPSGTL